MMKRSVFMVMFSWAVMAAPLSTADAAEQTVQLHVDNMTCPICPVTVKSAMMALDGVMDVSVSTETKSATVRFDDAKVSVAALAKASTNAGFPAKPKE